MAGALYVVSTPIGNLEDITLRALRILKEVDVIAAEDTRHTAILLRRYDIRTPTTSFHEHNERHKTSALVARLSRGERVALVSDAGTPGISDPGYRLVRAVLDAGLPVQAIPGPSAILAALVSSGFPSESFTFLGFPPKKKEARRLWAQRLAVAPRTIIFFEAPHRLRRTLEDLQNILGDRPICIARELTKIHEQLVIRPITEQLQLLDVPRGEYVVLVPPQSVTDRVLQVPTDKEVNEFIGDLTNNERASKRAGVTLAARHFGLPAKAVYAALERTKKPHESP